MKYNLLNKTVSINFTGKEIETIRTLTKMLFPDAPKELKDCVNIILNKFTTAEKYLDIMNPEKEK